MPFPQRTNCFFSSILKTLNLGLVEPVEPGFFCLTWNQKYRYFVGICSTLSSHRSRAFYFIANLYIKKCTFGLLSGTRSVKCPSEYIAFCNFLSYFLCIFAQFAYFSKLCLFWDKTVCFIPPMQSSNY